MEEIVEKTEKDAEYEKMNSQIVFLTARSYFYHKATMKLMNKIYNCPKACFHQPTQKLGTSKDFKVAAKVFVSKMIQKVGKEVFEDLKFDAFGNKETDLVAFAVGGADYVEIV